LDDETVARDEDKRPPSAIPPGERGLPPAHRRRCPQMPASCFCLQSEFLGSSRQQLPE
jgi:hypothetical protein